jgi:hypothetical protein
MFSDPGKIFSAALTVDLENGKVAVRHSVPIGHLRGFASSLIISGGYLSGFFGCGKHSELSLFTPDGRRLLSRKVDPRSIIQIPVRGCCIAQLRQGSRTSSFRIVNTWNTR